MQSIDDFLDFIEVLKKKEEILKIETLKDDFTSKSKSPNDNS